MKKHLSILLMLTLAPLASYGGPAEKKGMEIAKKADAADNGWKDLSSSMVMTLKDQHNRVVTRAIRNKTMEVPGDGDKSLIIYDAPPDLKGTAFLSFTHVNKPDDQWLYLKSLKRVKRISSNNKSGPFMGSEFSYEDISSPELDKYEYKYIKDEKVNGVDSYKVEQIPTYKYSGYEKIITWYNKSTYRPEKQVFYDRKGSKLKTLKFIQYKKYLGKFYRPDKMYMVNHLSGKTTTLIYKNYKFQNNYTDSDFDVNALKRAR